ncbi:hypothetical protein [Cardiobacterium hominis]|uniref:hypothetical protein n=1 Tax=Cardiobacterium hominis TaxID=2718 RepID=UPI000B0C163B|nr:hypothetical protein [Cardiobacterium hominis]
MTPKQPPAADKPNWGEPVFPIHAPYPGGYSPTGSPRFPGIAPDAPPLTHKIRITTAPDPTPPPEPVVQKTQTDNAEPAPRLPRTPSQTKPKDPRMALGKLLFGSSNRRTPVLEWQKLKSRNNKHIAELYRTAVPGGWLISQSGTGGLVFLPDPDHEWDGDSLTLYPDNND